MALLKYRLSDISLRFSLNLTILLGILIAALLSSYLVYEYAKNQRLEDAWAIYFLNLEFAAEQLSRDLEQTFALAADSDSSLLAREVVVAAPDHAASLDNTDIKAWLVGEIKGLATLDEALHEPLSTQAEIKVFENNGFHYLGLIANANEASLALGKRLPQGRYLLTWNLKIAELMARYSQEDKKFLLYLVNRDGQLIYASDEAISKTYVQKSENLKLFISSPMNQGQFEFSKEDQTMYGFFQKIPGSNLVLFTELKQGVVLTGLNEAKDEFLLYLLVIIAATMLMLQIIFSYLFKPIHSLGLDSVRLANGEFNHPIAVRGFGELKSLASSLDRMRNRLKDRDSELATQHAERLEKQRIQIELNLAKQLQENFMHKSNLNADSRVAIYDFYLPASEIAGDWFSYHSHNQQSFAVIADVSGHGIGSALFTSILSALFVEHFISTAEPNITEFILQVHSSFNHIGRGNIHATLALAHIHHEQAEIRLYSAGHVTSFIGIDGASMSPVSLPSNPLGLNLKLQIAKKRFNFRDQFRIFMYTDCIIEQHPNFKSRQIQRTIESLAKADAKQFLPRFYKRWQGGLTAPARDDLCMLLIEGQARAGS